MKGTVLQSIEELASCLVFFFRETKRKRQIRADILLLDWGIGFITVISIFSELTNLTGHILQAIIGIATLIDGMLFTISMFPEIFAMCFKVKKGGTLVEIEEGLILYAILKSSILCPLLFMQNISLDQQLIVYIKLLSSFHLVLVTKPINSIELIIEIFKGKVKHLIPLVVSLLIIVCVYLARIHFCLGIERNEDLKVKYLIALSVSLLVIFGNMSWVKFVEGIQSKKDESNDSKEWLKNLNHLHLPVIALKQDYSILYSNRTAKDYFSPLNEKRIKTFCSQLVDIESLDETRHKLSLADHLEHLFTTLSDISSYTASSTGSRQYLFSKKRYIVQKTDPLNFSITDKPIEETIFQIDIFEVGRKEQAEEYLILLINDNISTKDSKELQNLNRSAIEFVVNEVMRQTIDIDKILGVNEDLDCKLLLTSLKRINNSIAVLMDLSKPEGETICREVKVELFLEEIKELFEPIVKYFGGRFVCTYTSKLTSWNIDYNKVKGLLVNLLNIGLLHVMNSNADKDITISIQVIDKKLSVNIAYQKATLPSDIALQEKSLQSLCDDILFRMNGAIKHAQTRIDNMKIILELPLLNVTQPPRLSSIEESHDLSSIAEVSENSGYSARGDLSFGKKGRFTITSKKSIRDSENDLHINVASKFLCESQSPLVQPIETEGCAEIPSEFPEGITNLALLDNYIKIYQRPFNKCEESKVWDVLKKTAGVIIAENVIAEQLSLTLEKQGLHEIIILKEEKFKIKKNIKIVLIYIEICKIPLKEIMIKIVNIIQIHVGTTMIIEIRCGECKGCNTMNKEFITRNIAQVTYYNIESVPLLPTLLANPFFHNC